MSIVSNRYPELLDLCDDEQLYHRHPPTRVTSRIAERRLETLVDRAIAEHAWPIAEPPWFCEQMD